MQIFRRLVWLLSISWGLANAAPVTWTASFGGPALGSNSGTFTYDPVTDQLISWDIYGFSAPGCPGGPPCQPHGAGISANGEVFTFWSISSSMYYGLVLDLANPLSTVEATTLVPGSCVICQGPGFDQGSTTSGSGYLEYDLTVGNGIFEPILQGNVTASPEPSAQILILLLLITLLARAEIRNSSHKSSENIFSP